MFIYNGIDTDTNMFTDFFQNYWKVDKNSASISMTFYHGVET